MRKRGNQKKQNNAGLLIIAVCVLVFFLLLEVVYTVYVVKGPKSDNEETVIPFDDQEETESTEETGSTEESAEETGQTEESSEEETSYPVPEYEFNIEEVSIPIKGLSKEYTLAWVSDLHLISDHEAGEAMGDVHAEYLDAIEKRYDELPVTEDGVHAEELWPEIVKYLNYNKFDGVIFGGDIMDYCSNSNVAQIKEGLDALRMPYIYVRADHDYGTYYGGVFFTEAEARKLHQTIDKDESGNKFWDRNDFLVLGIDNSTKDMPDYYLSMVAEVYTRGKPVIMATHVPYESQDDDSLAELSMKVRNTIYYWSDKSDRYKPNDVTKQYLDLIYSEDTAVKQVLAGHLHAAWDGMISKQVPQHIFAPAFSGNIGVIHIVPE